ncbi:NAD(P)H-dependent oxidoreductase [Paracoccus aminophilus]|uniref:NADPH-dependent FMN reductase n=1 Tax=Paracoccus aminophilus JCM 7686 TaxID=1367847 RepID=S5YE83_PARAH|nr:NAD(P)H-dependent oxidoreductase [Paracoccus aminophilus]AGT09798.1 NADPH-dependent FMN reductase [Paracoccus aminophilus JCM 7686]
MSGFRFVGFAGSWSAPSKTRALVDQAAERATARFGGSAHVFDLTDLGEDFAALSHIEKPTERTQRHLEALRTADALIVASPVFKGSFTGLFKHVIDLLEPAALQDKPILLAATGGGHRHALVIEHQLRPLFGFFEARTLATGLYASSSDFAEGRLVSPDALARLDRAIGQFAPYIPVKAEAVSQPEPLRA